MHDTLHPAFLALSVAFLLTATATTTHGYYDLHPPSFPSPAEQAGAGAEPSDIRCNGDRVRTLHPDGRDVCVTRATADRLGWAVTEPVLTAEDIVGPRYRTHGPIAAAMICDESGPGVWDTTHPAIYERLNATGVLEPVCEDIEFAMLYCPRIGLLERDHERGFYSFTRSLAPNYANFGGDRHPVIWNPHPVNDIAQYLDSSGLAKFRGLGVWNPDLKTFAYPPGYEQWCHTVDFNVTTTDECTYLSDTVYYTTEMFYRLDNHLRYGPNDSTHVYDFDPDGPGISKDPAREVPGLGQSHLDISLDFERYMAEDYIRDTVQYRWCE